MTKIAKLISVLLCSTLFLTACGGSDDGSDINNQIKEQFITTTQNNTVQTQEIPQEETYADDYEDDEPSETLLETSIIPYFVDYGIETTLTADEASYTLANSAMYLTSDGTEYGTSDLYMNSKLQYDTINDDGLREVVLSVALYFMEEDTPNFSEDPYAGMTVELADYYTGYILPTNENSKLDENTYINGLSFNDENIEITVEAIPDFNYETGYEDVYCIATLVLKCTMPADYDGLVLVFEAAQPTLEDYISHSNDKETIIKLKKLHEYDGLDIYNSNYLRIE